MARHAAPTLLNRTTKRAVVAATAVATTAALSVAAPGTANADSPLPIDPGAILGLGPNAILSLSPIIPGAIPVFGIPLISPQIDKAVDGWNGILGLGDLTNASNTPDGQIGSALSWNNAPGWWTTISESETVALDGPIGFGVSNTPYGTVAIDLANLLDPDVLAQLAQGDFSGLNLGSTIGNSFTLTGPAGSSITPDMWLTTMRVNGTYTFTPGASINAIAPFDLGSSLFTFSPGSVTFGNGVYLLTGPSFTSSILGSDFGLSTGQIGFDNGDVVFTGPTGSATVANPLDPTTPIVDTSFTGGDGSVGLDGAHATGPTFDAEANGPLDLGGSASGDAGGIDVSTDLDQGITYTAPSGEAEINTPAGDAGANAHGGTYTANQNGVGLGDGDATTTQGDGLGGGISVNGGDTFDTNTNVEGGVDTVPSGSISYDTETSVNGDTVVDESDTVTVP